MLSSSQECNSDSKVYFRDVFTWLALDFNFCVPCSGRLWKVLLILIGTEFWIYFIALVFCPVSWPLILDALEAPYFHFYPYIRLKLKNLTQISRVLATKLNSTF